MSCRKEKLIGLGGTNISMTDIKNRVRNELGSSVHNSVTNDCSSLFEGSNIFKLKNVSGIKFGDVTMTNKLENSCYINTLLKNAEQLGMSAELEGTLVESQDAGLFGLNASTTDILNEVENEISTETVNNIYNDCRAQFKGIKNVIDFENVENVDAGAVLMTNDMFNECVQQAASDNLRDVGIDTKAGAAVEKDQVAEGLSLGFLVIIALLLFSPVILGGIGTGAVVYYGRDPKNWGIFIVAGFLIFVGLAMIWKVFFSCDCRDASENICPANEELVPCEDLGLLCKARNTISDVLFTKESNPRCP